MTIDKIVDFDEDDVPFVDGRSYLKGIIDGINIGIQLHEDIEEDEDDDIVDDDISDLCKKIDPEKQKELKKKFIPDDCEIMTWFDWVATQPDWSKYLPKSSPYAPKHAKKTDDEPEKEEKPTSGRYKWEDSKVVINCPLDEILRDWEDDE